MGALAILALMLWIFGGKQSDATTVALIGLCLMVLTGVISWDEVISHKSSWNVLVWFATLVAMPTVSPGLGSCRGSPSRRPRRCPVCPSGR